MTPNDDSVRTELDEGAIDHDAFRGGEHGYVTAEIACELWGFAKKHKLGRVYGPGTGFRLGHDTVRAPDAAFVRKERVEAIRSEGFAKGAPDLAVEVFSRSDSVRQLKRKVKQYLASGCRTVWVIYSKRRQVDVHETSGAVRTLGEDEMLEAPELLPGFSVKVADLFE